MRHPYHVMREAIIVGASVFAVGTILMVIPFPWRESEYWPYIGTFIAGFTAHWLWEFVGGNEWYCDQFEDSFYGYEGYS
jgi:hypothetical protein|tara:strand:- start:503 stop:739 length:237 start_codon:yes stop_codon:yes gene_type:complete